MIYTIIELCIVSLVHIYAGVKADSTGINVTWLSVNNVFHQFGAMHRHFAGSLNSVNLTHSWSFKLWSRPGFYSLGRELMSLLLNFRACFSLKKPNNFCNCIQVRPNIMSYLFSTFPIINDIRSHVVWVYAYMHVNSEGQRTEEIIKQQNSDP